MPRGVPNPDRDPAMPDSLKSYLGAHAVPWRGSAEDWAARFARPSAGLCTASSCPPVSHVHDRAGNGYVVDGDGRWAIAGRTG